MAAKRTNITIPESLYAVAQKTMASQHYESFSEYVAELVRRDAVRNEDGRLREEPPQQWGGKKKSA